MSDPVRDRWQAAGAGWRRRADRVQAIGMPVSAWMNPSVTTIATPRYRIGYEAAQLLRAVIQGDKPPVTRIDLGFTLMARESA